MVSVLGYCYGLDHSDSTVANSVAVFKVFSDNGKGILVDVDILLGVRFYVVTAILHSDFIKSTTYLFVFYRRARDGVLCCLG